MEMCIRDRLQAELLAGQESAGAAHAGLYFVHNNQNIVGVARCV